MRPGCIVNIKFKTVNDEGGYGGYLSYMDRAEAVGGKEHGMTYEGYTDYMGNEEKSHGLFTEDKDVLASIEKRKMQDIYKVAYERGSLLWQPIISFDNAWLEENHIYNSEKNILDEAKLREATRNYMRVLIEKENLGNPVWSAAIHYNTDNIHIHVGLVELTPTRNADGRQVNGKAMEKGLFKMKNIEQSKSRFVNIILDQKKENEIINTIMRETIIKGKKDMRMVEEEKFYEPFLQIYEKLPEDRRTWKYGMNAMKNLRPELDKLSKMYIETYHKDSFKELVTRIVRQQTTYARAYGTKSEAGKYLQNKIGDLYQRLGNAILDEMRDFDKKMRYSSKEKDKSEKIKKTVNKDEFKRYQEGKQYEWNKKYDEAFRCYSEAAEMGNKFAQYKVGMMYLNGSGCNADIEAGTKWIEKSIEKNDGQKIPAASYYVLGRLYERDGQYEAAFKYYDKGNEAGTPISDIKYRLGKLYLEGKGCKKDVLKGIGLLKEASENQDVRASFLLGKIYEENKNSEKALQYYQKSIDKSSDKIDTDHKNDEGDQKNVQSGIALLKQASTQGSVQATYLLGKIYEQDENYEKAFEYYSKSAGEAHELGQYKTGKMYVEGKGCKKNINKGIEFLKKASDQGNVVATYSLGKAYEQKGDFEKAFTEYQKSADASYSWGQFKVGTMYINGMGCKKNVSEGVKWLEKSSANGNKYAEIALYRRGRVGSSVKSGVTDLKRAMRQLRHSMKSEYETFRNIQEYDFEFDKAMQRRELEYEHHKY